jgi:hypothetical protein
MLMLATAPIAWSSHSALRDPGSGNLRTQRESMLVGGLLLGLYGTLGLSR